MTVTVDAGTMVLSFLLLAATLAFVGWPLARPVLAPEGPSGREQRRETLEDEKERLFAVLRDLEHDRATGKVAPEDFETLAGKLKLEAARVLKEIDVNEGRKVRRGGEPAEPKPGRSEEPKRREAPLSRNPPAPPKPIVPDRPTATTAESPHFCSKCGWRAKADDDRFCGKCGAPLPEG